MNQHRITILKSQEGVLRDWLTNHPDGHERGAIVLFRRFARRIKGLPTSERFLAVDIILMSDDWVIDSSGTHFTINMKKFPDLYFRCENENLCLGFIHNHPKHVQSFSAQDNHNEKNILAGLSACNGIDSLLISLVFVNNLWIARIRTAKDPNNAITVRHVSILGKKIELHNIDLSEVSDESLDRQEKAFGKPFNLKIRSLRVMVVGLGGTGSPLATLLARTGIREMILVDGDILEKSNMNRVRGYTGKDVRKRKAKSIAKFIRSLKLGVKILPISAFLDESDQAIDALSSVDIVFGCTDDVLGREFLNQAVYYYNLVYIDCGLSGNIGLDKEGIYRLATQMGRISCIMPEYGACLRCQNVVNDEKLYSEQALKDNPELRKLDPETLEKEYYIVGGGIQSPGIGAFTGCTAEIAVAQFMDLVSSHRNLPEDLRQDNIWVDFINMNFHSNMPKDVHDCIYCRERNLLTLGEGKYRLGIPRLGKWINYV